MIARLSFTPTRRPSMFLLSLVFILVASSKVLFAAVYVVDRLDDEPSAFQCTGALNDCSLRGAINAANVTIEADEITLPGGVFYISISGQYEDDNATGDLDVVTDITFKGQGSDTTIIDGSALDRVFHIQGIGITVKLEDITVRNGREEFFGAGVYQTGGSLTISNCEIKGNDAFGITSFGGGVCSTSSLTISGSRVYENDAGTGGGLCILSGNLTASFIVVSNNSARHGAGVHAKSSLGSITYSSIANNDANSEGGGIYIDNSPLEIKNVTVYGNGAGEFGGGLFQFFDQPVGTATIINSTFSANKADGSGGGLHISQGKIDLSFVTITNNRTDADKDGTGNGGGIYKNLEPTAVLKIKNSIVAGNIDESTWGQVHPNCSGHLQSLNGNIFGDVTGTSGYSSGDKIDIDPKLSPIGDNGGPTLTHALDPTSEAVDFCADCTSVAADYIPKDQRDEPRPPYKLKICDSGSFEVQGIIVIPSSPVLTGALFLLLNQ